jgi:GntR family transcriptional regulator, trigonelline degradation regulator
MNHTQPQSNLVRANLVRRLRTLVTEGVYKPGERMVERELCERLAVSRTSLREALRQLEAEGLVEIIPHKGPIVRTIDAAEVLVLWELSLSLEILIARRMALQATFAETEELQKSVNQLAAALASGDGPQIKACKNLFFEIFAAGAHNATLASYYLQLIARVSFLWTSSLMVPGRPEESIDEMNKLVWAIRTRNPEAAEAAVILYHQHAKAVSMYGLRVFEEAQMSRIQKSIKNT